LKYDLSRRLTYSAVLVGGLIVATGAAADDVYQPFAAPHATWSIFGGAMRTDNATLSAGGPSDTVATAGLGVSLYRDSGYLRADVEGSALYEDYHDHTYPSHVLGSLVGTAALTLIPGRLVWVLQDTFGQTNVNPLQPTTPTNRINANYVATGPDADVRLADATDLLIGARFAEANFQTNPFARVDDHSWFGTLGVREALTPSSSASLNIAASRVSYPNPTEPSYDQQDLYARYNTHSDRGGLAIDLGVSQLHDIGGTVHVPLARLGLFRSLTPSWNINIKGGSEFQNSGQALQSSFGDVRVINGQLVSGPAIGTGELPAGTVADINLSKVPFRSEFVKMAIDFVRPRTTLDLSGRTGHERYQAGARDLDRNTTEVGAAFTRLMRPTLEFHISGSYEHRTPLAALPADRTTSGRAGFNWRAGSLLAVTLAYAHEARSTEAGGAPYTVNLIYLGFAYGPPKPHVAFSTPGQAAPAKAPR
jgi:hypothetical protein